MMNVKVLEGVQDPTWSTERTLSLLEANAVRPRYLIALFIPYEQSLLCRCTDIPGKHHFWNTPISLSRRQGNRSLPLFLFIALKLPPAVP